MGKKIVIDTNNLISALGWNGKSRLLLTKTIDGEYELFISEDQLNELKKVMDYPKLKFTKEQKERFLKIIYHTARIIKTKSSIDIVSDKDDNKIIECAVDARAGYIITGDKEILKIKNYLGVKIITADDFLRE